MKKILPIFSYIFHPLFTPIQACFFYFLFHIADYKIEQVSSFFLQISIITIVTPMALYYLLRYTNKVDSIMIADMEQRKIPLIFQSFIIILLLRKTISLEYYPELHFFFLGALFSTLFALGLLYTKTKASLHMLAISALTVFVFGLNIHLQMGNIYLVPFLLLMNGFVASSRLVMQAHTPKELIIGLLLGSIPQLLFLFLWL
ncbi:hypothetical protein [Flavobacterium sp. M31R6]|uniref:hypothetical protein n=1 Tax=Flavobacterium sp. M31R6 TaxID=2739062 RepID=UPI0015680D3E|nr:hypothetical protein [Flavobacterium sp. M31R6]QKJ62310.1 hypothetical protein HQN62_03880 [Flavobacterium sp. M31R6]